MSNLRTNSDIVNDALWNAGEQIDGSSEFETKALEYVNRAYLAVCSGGTELDKDVDEDWWWLRSTTPNVITIQPPVTTTLQVTLNSAAAVMGVVAAQDMDGWFVRTNDTQDVFRISDSTIGVAAITLDSVYTGVNNAAVAATLFKLEYTLPDNVMEILPPMRVYQNSQQEIEGMDLSSLEERWPLSEIWQDIPEAWAFTGNRKIRFSHQGNSDGSLIRVDHDYLILPTELAKNAQEPLVPVEFRRVIADYAAMFILRDKDDNKMTDVAAMAKGGLTGMAKANQNRRVNISNNFGAIIPRQSQVNRKQYPLRTTGGRIVGW